MNQLKTTLLLALLTVLMVLMGSAVGGKAGMVFAFLMACAMNLFSYWFSDRIVLKMYGAQEITEMDHPAFFGMVRRLALQAGLPMPKVYIIPSESPNAFATGRNPDHAAVAATEGILRILAPDELEGVMAHELAHVKNRDILVSTIAATFAGAISMLGNMLQWGAILGTGRGDDEEGHGGLAGSLAMAIIAPIAAMLDPDGGLPLPRVPGRRVRRPPLRPSPGAGQCPAQAAQCIAGAPHAGGASGHGPPVHRQSAHRGRPAQAVLHPSAHGGADREA